MAGVDDTEAIPLGIGQHDEVGVRWIRVPRNAGGAEADQSLDLGGLFGSVVDDEVQMNRRMLLSRRIRPLERNSRSLARRRNEDRESVARGREANGFIPEDMGPEGHRTIDVVGAEHDGS